MFPGQEVESGSQPERSVAHSAQVSPLRELSQREALCSQAGPQVEQLVPPAQQQVQRVSERREHQVLAQPAEQVSAQRALPLSLPVRE